MVEQAERLKEECERVVRDTVGGRALECEVWRQEGSGSHRYGVSGCLPCFRRLLDYKSSFDMMNKRLYKTYVNLSNIVMRISNGTSAGKEHAVLVNSHLDSTLPSPGAADDAMSVGVSFRISFISFRSFLSFPCVRDISLCADDPAVDNAGMYQSAGQYPRVVTIIFYNILYVLSLLPFSLHITEGYFLSTLIVFNNAEESLQDGSHLFSTQHPIAST